MPVGRLAAVGKDASDEGEAVTGRLEWQLTAVTVLDVGAMHPDAEKPAIGVGQDVPFAPGDLLARVIAFVAPF